MSDKPLRVCIVVPYDLAEQGGVRFHACDLARELRRAGDEVTIMGPSSRPVDAPGVKTLRGVVSWRSNGAINRVALLVSPAAVWRYFREHAVDVVHVHEPPVPTLPHWVAWLLPNTPKVCTFHAFAENPGLILRTAQRLTSAVELGSYDRAIAVSHSAAQYANRVWKGPMCVIPNGVSTERFRPSRSPRSTRGPVRLLFVGRLGDPRKGLKHLLDAYRLLRARGVDVTLDVVGEPRGAPSLPALPGLTYFGPLPLSRLVERYRACDLFVAPSTGQESFGIILLEAMSCARPVVCSDIGGYREVAPQQGARFVLPADPEALADAITALAASPRRRAAMGEFNERYVRRYRWSEIARRVRHEYLLAIQDRAERRRGRRSAAPRFSAAVGAPTREPAAQVEPRPDRALAPSTEVQLP